MKTLLLTLVALLSFSYLFSQNIGIGTTTPTEKLDVNGNIRGNIFYAGIVSTNITYTFGLVLTANQNSDGDFLKADAVGQVGFRKGFGGVGLRYIIAVGGTSPNTGGYDHTLVGEIKLYAGINQPPGWMFCEGQLLAIVSQPDLFTVIGTTYGGDGATNFALPDLKDKVPVSASPSGGNWEIGETVE